MRVYVTYNCGGRLFQVDGAATEIAEFSPCGDSSGRWTKTTLGGVIVDKLNQTAEIWWTVLVKYTVHEGGDFEGDSLRWRTGSQWSEGFFKCWVSGMMWCEPVSPVQEQDAQRHILYTLQMCNCRHWQVDENEVTATVMSEMYRNYIANVSDSKLFFSVLALFKVLRARLPVPRYVCNVVSVHFGF